MATLLIHISNMTGKRAGLTGNLLIEQVGNFLTDHVITLGIADIAASRQHFVGDQADRIGIHHIASGCLPGFPHSHGQRPGFFPCADFNGGGGVGIIRIQGGIDHRKITTVLQIIAHNVGNIRLSGWAGAKAGDGDGG